MVDFDMTFSISPNFNMSFEEEGANFEMDVGTVQEVVTSDYNKLINKPSIN